jgi:hypothetical protein
MISSSSSSRPQPPRRSLRGGGHFSINANCGTCGRPLRPIDLQQMPFGVRLDCPFCCTEVIDLVDPRLIRRIKQETEQ